jgi:hypothetical protein
MNLQTTQQNEANQIFQNTSHELRSLLATVVFWAFMLSLVTCPAWLPGVVEHFIKR